MLQHTLPLLSLGIASLELLHRFVTAEVIFPLEAIGSNPSTTTRVVSTPPNLVQRT